MTFGKGTPLRQFSPVLRDAAKRHRMILDRTERDSVIEGLPRFTKAVRRACLLRIRKIAATH